MMTDETKTAIYSLVSAIDRATERERRAAVVLAPQIAAKMIDTRSELTKLAEAKAATEVEVQTFATLNRELDWLSRWDC